MQALFETCPVARFLVPRRKPAVMVGSPKRTLAQVVAGPPAMDLAYERVLSGPHGEDVMLAVASVLTAAEKVEGSAQVLGSFESPPAIARQLSDAERQRGGRVGLRLVMMPQVGAVRVAVWGGAGSPGSHKRPIPARRTWTGRHRRWCVTAW